MAFGRVTRKPSPWSRLMRITPENGVQDGVHRSTWPVRLGSSGYAHALTAAASLELPMHAEEAHGCDGGRDPAPVQPQQFVETAISDETELNLLGAEPCAAGEDGPFTQDEAGQVRIVGRVVWGAHRWLGEKDAPSIDVLATDDPHTDLAVLSP